MCSSKHGISSVLVWSLKLFECLHIQFITLWTTPNNSCKAGQSRASGMSFWICVYEQPHPTILHWI